MTDITNTPEHLENTEPAISYSTCYGQYGLLTTNFKNGSKQNIS